MHDADYTQLSVFSSGHGVYTKGITSFILCSFNPFTELSRAILKISDRKCKYLFGIAFSILALT